MPGIMRCRLDDLVLQTPVQSMPALSRKLGIDLQVKREDLQPVFSFKLRGAYAKLQKLSRAEKQRGVICASAGNHAQGVALAARHLHLRAVIVMPAITPEIKIRAVEELGAQVIIHGDNFDAACERAYELAAQGNLTFVHPYDDPDVITGQATIATELYRQCPVTPDYLFVPIGGGGLAAGMAIVSKYLQPKTRIIGVEADESASMKAAFEAGEPVTLNEVGHFAEGVAVKRTGDLTFDICSDLVDEIITVDNDEICAAVQDVYEDTRAIAEPAGALAIAGVKRYFMDNPDLDGTAAAVLSGANVNFARLRHIAERAAVGEEQEALFGVTIPERPGSFLEFCEAVGMRGITEFNYRYADQDDAHIFVGVALKNGLIEKQQIIDQLSGRDLPVIDLSSNNERILRFQFPERPGALLQFLKGMQSGWNISLFHYRNYGSEYGRVLMGIQVPARDEERFQEFLASTGYNYTEEADNPVYHMFVGPA
jgi:threonine dehydratase